MNESILKNVHFSDEEIPEKHYVLRLKNDYSLSLEHIYGNYYNDEYDNAWIDAAKDLFEGSYVINDKPIFIDIETPTSTYDKFEMNDPYEYFKDYIIKRRDIHCFDNMNREINCYLILMYDPKDIITMEYDDEISCTVFAYKNKDVRDERFATLDKYCAGKANENIIEL